MPRILIWDIETRGLQADYGSILCIGWKWLDEKAVHVKSIHDIPGKHPLDDTELVRWFIAEVWNKADIAVGWYSTGHDEPFLLTRAIVHGLHPAANVTHLDLWGKVWKRFKFSRNSLDNVSRHLGIGEKYYSPPQDFERVLWGDKAAMKRIVKHCRVDVELTEKAYLKFRSFIKAHPRVTFKGWECRVCGNKKLQRRGYQYSAAKGRQVRVQCQSCYAWDSKTVKEAEAIDEKG